MKPRSEHFAADRLVDLRNAKSLSQRDVARLAGISQAQVAELERGKRQPTVEVAERIAAALGIAVSDLAIK
jgi:transcriptional regulator with XRE-family HTH domain